MQRRIRWRIVLPYLLLLVVVVTIFSILTFNHLRQLDENRCEQQIQLSANLLASELSRTLDTNGGNFFFTDLAQQNADVLGMNVVYLDQNGALLGSSSGDDLLLSDQEIITELITDAKLTGQASLSNEQGLSAVAAFQDSDNQNLGFVLLNASLMHCQLDLTGLSWYAVAIVLVSGTGMFLLAIIIQDTSIVPIEKLTIAAQQMSMGNFTNLEFPETREELKDLNQALQTMAHQVDIQIDALTSERAKLSTVLNQMADGVMIVDPNGRVQLLNHAAERIFQIRESKAIDRSVVEVVRYHQLVDLWRDTTRGKRQSTMLEIGPQHHFLQVVGIPLKTTLSGSTLILFHDLTQLRRLETVRRDFISNVSHELRTPLASLKALAETLQEGALDDPPAAIRFLLRMETEIDNLTQMVNELLELSRIESGKVPLSFQRIQACSLLKPAYDRMILQAERAGLEMIFECPPDLPVVFADPDRITQVLINLVHNAIKFTAPGGKITLSAYQEADRIVFFVRDTGVGIDKNDLGRIFERFYKADRARAGGGTGLGLSISRHMVEAHGGFIWVESEPDLGSTFYFNLPVA
jgi:two-component system phosphate regulon sensor histidine kinase PhoR